MQIKRVIFVYDKISEELIDEIPMDIPLESLKCIFIPYEEDPDLIMPYDITVERACQLQQLLNTSFNLLKNIYQMECYQE